MNHRTHLPTLATALLTVMLCNPAAAETPSDRPYIDGGRIVRPATETSPFPPADKAYSSTAQNFVIRWLSPFYGVNGTLDDDLIGEAAVEASCSSDRLGGGATAPYAYTSTGLTNGLMYLNSYDAPADNQNVVQHFLTQVESTTARQVVMLVGADDGIRVWLNGDEVLRQDAPAEYVEGAHRVPVSLRAGWNLLLVKVYYPQLGPRNDPDHDSKNWSLRFAEPDGVTPVLDVYQSVDAWCSPADGRYSWVYAPGAADATGAFDSQWQSELRITNPYYHNLSVTVQYFDNSNVSGMPDGERVLHLDAFETVIYDNVVRELMGASGGRSGMVALNGLYYGDVSGYDAARLTTNNVGGAGGGAFGTQVPFAYLYRGVSCCSQQLYGLKNGPGHRTNLLVAPTPFVADEAVLTVNLWDPESGRTASGEFTGSGSFQINDIFDRVGMGGVETTTALAYITYNRTASNANINILASINDNVTSDPTVVTRAPSTVPTPFQ